MSPTHLYLWPNHQEIVQSTTPFPGKVRSAVNQAVITIFGKTTATNKFTRKTGSSRAHRHRSTWPAVWSCATQSGPVKTAWLPEQSAETDLLHNNPRPEQRNAFHHQTMMLCKLMFLINKPRTVPIFVVLVEKTTALLSRLWYRRNEHILFLLSTCPFSFISKGVFHGQDGIQLDSQEAWQNPEAARCLARDVAQDNTQLRAGLALHTGTHRAPAFLSADQAARPKRTTRSLLGSEGMPGKRRLSCLGIPEWASLLVPLRHPVRMHQRIILQRKN